MTSKSMLLLCFIFCLFASSASQADNEQHVIRLGSRVFYTGEEIPSVGVEPNFIPLNRIDWLNEILGTKPTLKNTVIHIDLLNRTSEFLWSPTGPSDAYIHPEPVPEHLRLPGYTVNSSSENSLRLLYLTPKTSNKQFALGCSAERDSKTFEYCGLTARYPLDPRIIILTRIYHPPPVDELAAFFEDIAEISVGIALCLDVTDEHNGSTKQETKAYLEGKKEGNNSFCDAALSS
ncbi:hypothetical protein [Ruegeria meonggei]|uniref:Uncharacterized protein n=1 Tax=Ruegeria meonggei TaxID=1446476 RepID=A0A1X7A9X9_9RHOB|nr:hypothetical protein [Ruegeria meonggei]SLN73690.1 hypothetical protein RUM8411_03902 [Ruegeria meonggei]